MSCLFETKKSRIVRMPRRVVVGIVAGTGAVWMANLPSAASGAVITPTSAFANTYYSGSQNPVNLINNAGLDTSSGNVLTYTHASDGSANGMWHAGAGQGTGGAAPVVANQYIVFDLGANYDLSSTYIWQMVQNNNLGRGIKEFALYGSSASMATPYPANPPLAGFTQILGASTLAQVTGTSANPNPAVTQTFSLTGAANVRTIYLDIISAWSGAANDYVGLSEIKFEGTALPPPPATLFNWTNTAGGSWQAGGNWSPSGPPTSNDDAAFAIAGAYTVLVTSTPAVRTLNVSAGDVTLEMYNNAATLQAADINVSGGKLTVPGLIGRASLPGVLNYTSSLNITNGGQVVSTGNSWGGVSVGTDGTTAQATVSGAGSSLSSASGFYVGAAGNGTLDITAGGKVTSAGILFAGSYGGTGNITVDGNHSALVVSSDNLLIGYGSNSGGTPGTASLTITNGGQVTNAAEIQIGAYGGRGSVIVGESDGTDSGDSRLLGNTLYVTIGATAGGSLTVNPGGSVELTGALNNTTNSGSINLAGGTIKASRFALNAASNMNWTAGTLWLTGGTSSAGSTTSTLAVPTAGILKGNGTINSRMAVLGTVSPGDDSTATLATRNLTIGNAGNQGTFAADVDFAGNAADLLSVTGTVNLTNAALDLSLLNAPADITTPLTFLLIANDSSDAVSGTFASVDLGGFSNFSYSIDYAFTGSALNGVGTGNDVAITFTAIPEPASLSLLALSGLALLHRRRAARHP